MKMLKGKSWAYFIGAAAGALVLSAAGGAWSAADPETSPMHPGELTPPAAPQAAPPTTPQKVAPPDMPQATPPTGTTEPGQAAAGRPETLESESLTTQSAATVTAIDRGERRATLKDPAGEKFVVSVPKDVKAFDTLKVGDRIDIDFYQSVALSIAPPGTKPGETERVAAAAGGGAEAMGKSLTVSAKVVSVDSEANEVTFKGPQGMNKTVKVKDPDLQKKVADLKAGDSVQLTFTEATAAEIRPAASK
jgi:hypothetical protein